MGPLVGTVGLFCMELTAASPFRNHAVRRVSRANSCGWRGKEIYVSEVR
ncbi:hypothetical protein [Fowl aviadenovirus 4]|nr:hypothetical protein [Fowl aviadenovirus 4]